MKYDASKRVDDEWWLSLEEDEHKALCEQHHKTKRERKRHEGLGSLELHVAVHVVVENQLAMGEPPEALAALERLLESGLDRHDAIHAIGSCVARVLFQMGNGEPKTNEDYVESLRRLTRESWYAQEDDEDAEGLVEFSAADLADLPVFDRVRQTLLRKNSKALSSDARAAILELGAEAVPALLALAQDANLVDVWAPLHAIELLGELKATAAIPLLLKLVLETAPEAYDLNDALVLALAKMGDAVVEPALDVYASAEDWKLRHSIADILAHSGVRDERIFQLFVKGLDEDPSLGLYAGGYGDERLIEHLGRTLDRLEPTPESSVNFDIRVIGESIEELGGGDVPGVVEIRSGGSPESWRLGVARNRSRHAQEKQEAALEERAA